MCDKNMELNIKNNAYLSMLYLILFIITIDLDSLEEMLFS